MAACAFLVYECFMTVFAFYLDFEVAIFYVDLEQFKRTPILLVIWILLIFGSTVAMPFVECLIRSCRKTIYDETLFNFPRNESLQKEWLERISPHCPEVLELSSAQLRNRKVCVRHFEQKFLIGQKRLYHACPTLITEEEITSGLSAKPFVFKADTDHIYSISTAPSDHTYCKRPLCEPSSSQITKIQKIDNHATINADPSALPSTSKQNPLLLDENVEYLTLKHGPTKPSTTEVSTSKTTEADSPILLKKKMRLIASVKCLTPKCQKLYNKCKKIIKGRKLFSRCNNKEVIENATKLNETRSFQKLVEKLDYTQKTFIMMQLKTASQNKKAHRYTLEEKLLCLALFKQSPKGYKLLEKMFTLPSKRTLNRILQYMPLNTGINVEFFHALKTKISNWNTIKKLCSIVFDEVQLSPGVNFMPSSNIIHGFIPDKENPIFADHALVFMARGICGSWRQPIAYYYCEGTMPTMDLVKIIKDIVHAVVSIGLEPLAFICDQGMTNQSALKKLQEMTRGEQLKNGVACDDTIYINGCNINVIYDPPHLLKGIRNNLLNKNMLFEGKLVKWQDIIDIYNYDSHIGTIRMLPKLTDEHIVPEKIKKMKVSHCTQVLSERVAATLRYTATFSQRTDGSAVSATAENTADAVEFFDQLFDSCNGSRAGRAAGKMRMAVKITSPHKNFWAKAIKIIKNIKYIENSETKKIKYVPTLKNWVTTLESMIRLSDILFSKGVSFFYTRNLNQDPLENFFGRIRSLNYRNNSPDSYSFQNSFKSLIMTNMLSVHSNHGNCEEDIGATIINLEQLLSTCPPEDICNETFVNVSHNIATQRPAENPQTSSNKINCNARGFTAGYVVNKLSRQIKCSQCRKTMVAKDLTNMHTLITYRERKSLKNRNLKYPSTQIIVAFSVLIDLTNEYLAENCHKKGLLKNIKEIFYQDRDLEWLGCPTHKKELEDNFINITVKLQIFNWCKAINHILGGRVQQKINLRDLDAVQTLAYKKFLKNRKYKSKK